MGSPDQIEDIQSYGGFVAGKKLKEIIETAIRIGSLPKDFPVS
jgi:hypothetical protein